METGRGWVYSYPVGARLGAGGSFLSCGQSKPLSLNDGRLNLVTIKQEVVWGERESKFQDLRVRSLMAARALGKEVKWVCTAHGRVTWMHLKGIHQKDPAKQGRCSQRAYRGSSACCGPKTQDASNYHLEVT